MSLEGRLSSLDNWTSGFGGARLGSCGISSVCSTPSAPDFHVSISTGSIPKWCPVSDNNCDGSMRPSLSSASKRSMGEGSSSACKWIEGVAGPLPASPCEAVSASATSSNSTGVPSSLLCAGVNSPLVRELWGDQGRALSRLLGELGKARTHEGCL